MNLVVGLGNPGRRYAGTRHNIGFGVVDLIAERHHALWESAPRGIDAVSGRYDETIGGESRRIHLAKPLTYMNLSGSAVRDLLQFYKIEPSQLLVIVDDVNLELGRLRARPAGSAGGHNGLKSIIGVLATEEFSRLRVGVGRGDARRDLADHVTARFEPEERPIVAEAVTRAADAAELFIAEGIGPVMNRFNRKEDGD